MIQRVQSLYLFAGIILSAAILFSGVFFVTNGTENMVLGAFGIKEGNLNMDFPTMIPVMVLAVAMILIQGFAFSQFKNRKLQSNVVKLNMLVCAVLMGWIGFEYYAISSQGFKVMPFVGVFHSPLIFFANIMTLRGITKDEALVKSVDRLR